MTPGASSTPGDAQASSADEALLAELDQFEGLTPAVRLERIAEHEILILLQLGRFDPASAEWRTLAMALTEYGYAVFKAWVTTGTVRRMAANHAQGRGVLGIGKIPEGLRLDDDEAHALVVELMITAVESFRTKTLMSRKRTWRPDRGASLKTYFIGHALMALPDVYRRWRTAEGSPIGLLSETHLDDGRHVDDASKQALDSLQVDEILNDPDTRAMFVLQQAGYALNEIAELLTLAGSPQTEASVRSRMSRLRARARSVHESDRA